MWLPINDPLRTGALTPLVHQERKEPEFFGFPVEFLLLEVGVACFGNNHGFLDAPGNPVFLVTRQGGLEGDTGATDGNLVKFISVGQNGDPGMGIIHENCRFF